MSVLTGMAMNKLLSFSSFKDVLKCMLALRESGQQCQAYVLTLISRCCHKPMFSKALAGVATGCLGSAGQRRLCDPRGGWAPGL